MTADAQEVQNDRDRLLGKPVARFLHPSISNFIHKRLEEICSTGQTPSHMENQAKRLEETWVRIHSDTRITNIASPRRAPQDKAPWETDPRPQMANHPTRVTDSNTRISLSEDALNGPCPRDDSGLGWVQIQRKSLLWEERIEGFSIITHEDLTTLAHPEIGWTITSGMWNTECGTQYLISSRKFGRSVWLMSQDYTSVPKVLVRNLNYFILFKINDNISLNNIMRRVL